MSIIRRKNMQIIAISLLIISFLIPGCATPVYKEILKEKPSYNSKEFSVSKDTLYQASIKTVFAKNFIVESEDQEKGFILAKRSFQRGKRTIALLLQVKIIPDGENKSTIYLNALQTTERSYIADRTRFFMFIIPLPGGGGKEATQIKEGEKVIEDKEFYQSLFSYIDEEINKNITAKESEKE
jgi:hypothetical protein